MSRLLKPFWLIVFCFSISTSFVDLRGTEPQDDAERAEAEKLVAQALYNEIYGDAEQRSQLLDAAAQHAPDFAPAMWHRGYVRQKDQWIKVADLVEQNKNDPLIARYQRLKDKQPDTAAGHWSAANWCHKFRLFDREQAHLEAVVQAEPNHVEARIRLGHALVNGIWMTNDQVNEQARRVETEAGTSHLRIG